MLNTVTVTWTEEDVGEAPLGGYVSFQLTADLYDQADGIDVRRNPAKTFFFNGPSGTSTPLVANDSTVTPAGTAYVITVAIRGQEPVTFTSQILFAAGASQTLAYLQASAAVPVTQYSQYMPLAGGAFLGEISPAVGTLAQSGGSVAVPAALANAFNLTLTSSGWAIAAPAPPADGQVLRFRILQDATGGRTVTWASGTGGYDFGTTGAPVLASAANALTIAAFEYVALTARWRYLGTPPP